MINCAHPSHFAGVLSPSEGWTSRIRGLRANASRRSHAELDAATDLDAGDPLELAAAYAELAFSGEHPSFLQVPGAKELGVEFGSLSKSYCMTGWRIGFVAGNAAAVGGLVRLKENIDTGAFGSGRTL